MLSFGDLTSAIVAGVLGAAAFAKFADLWLLELIRG